MVVGQILSPLLSVLFVDLIRFIFKAYKYLTHFKIFFSYIPVVQVGEFVQ